MQRVLIRVGCLLLSAGIALAQEPLMGSEANPAQGSVLPDGPPLPDGWGGEDGVFRILIVGDSLAGGMGAGMTRVLQGDSRYEIVNRFNEASGLARPEFYDWAAAIPKIVNSKSYDAIVVMMGVNDRQDIRNGNFRYPFKSPEWVKGYQETIERVLAAAHEAGAPVYWVGQPPMADPVFDADMQYLSGLQKQSVEQAKQQFIEVRQDFLTRDGQYVDHGPDDQGVDRKLRSRDGITFFKQGNNRFGQLVVAAIEQRQKGLPSRNAEPAALTTTMAPSSSPPVPAVAPPLFGQAGLDGEVISFDAKSISPGGTKATVQPAAGVLQATAVQVLAAKGTAAERLLRDGLVDLAPNGRFDDFSVPVAAEN